MRKIYSLLSVKIWIIILLLFTGCTSDKREVRPVSVDTVKIELDSLNVGDSCFQTFVEIDTQRISIRVIDTIQHIDTLTNKDGIIGKPVKYLAIHCTASRPNSTLSDIGDLDWWRRNRGWNKWGYHVVFFRDGTTQILNPHFRLDAIMEKREMVNGVQGLNSHTISIAYVGGCAEKLRRRTDGRLELVSEDNITAEQLAAMRAFVLAVKFAIPDIQIGGHRDYRAWMKKSYKACPSFDVMDKFSAEIGQNQFTYE